MTEQVHTLIGAYVLDAVDDTERALVEQHLTECPECEQEVRELRVTTARLADLTAVEPPARMRAAVLATVHRTRQDPPPEGSPQDLLKPRRLPRWRRALVTAAVLLVVAISAVATTFAVMQQRIDDERARNDEISTVLAATDAEVSLKDAEGGGRVTVISSAEHDKAVVVLSGLEGIDADRAYQLWLVQGDTQTSAGVIADGHNSATVLVSGVNDADILGVTNEPAGGSDAPTLPMVADVALPN